MSSISSVSATPVQPSPPVKIADATPIKVDVSKTSANAPSATQEATETPDVTRKEAAKGDKQAINLLAKEAAQQQQGGTRQVSIKA